MKALRAMSVVPAEARLMVVAIVAVRSTSLMTMMAVAMMTAVVMLAAAVVMVTADARATAMAVTSLAASGGSNGRDGMTTNVCDAIPTLYADVVNVMSNDDGDRAPTFNEGNIVGGVVNFDNVLLCVCGGQQ